MKVVPMRKKHGWIQVKDQAIIVQDPVNGGDLPVISSIAPVKLFVNDEVVETERTVCSTDRIRWEIDEKPLYDIPVSKDKLMAFFQFNSKNCCAWRLEDVGPQHRIIITAEEDKILKLNGRMTSNE